VKKSFLILLALAATVPGCRALPLSFPINNGVLQSPLNANGQPITNAAALQVGTNTLTQDANSGGLDLNGGPLLPPGIQTNATSAWTNNGVIYWFGPGGQLAATNTASGAHWLWTTNGHFRQVDQYGDVFNVDSNHWQIAYATGNTLQYSNDGSLYLDGFLVPTNPVTVIANTLGLTNWTYAGGNSNRNPTNAFTGRVYYPGSQPATPAVDGNANGQDLNYPPFGPGQFQTLSDGHWLYGPGGQYLMDFGGNLWGRGGMMPPSPAIVTNNQATVSFGTNTAALFEGAFAFSDGTGLLENPFTTSGSSVAAAVAFSNPANSFSGIGAGLTGIFGSSVTWGNGQPLLSDFAAHHWFNFADGNGLFENPFTTNGSTVSAAVTFLNPADQFSGTFTGNGAGTTNQNVANLASGNTSSSNHWIGTFTGGGGGLTGIQLLTNEMTRNVKFVDAGAGSDSNPGDANLPWSTIAHAQTNTPSGFTLCVAPGSYVGSITNGNVNWYIQSGASVTVGDWNGIGNCTVSGGGTITIQQNNGNPTSLTVNGNGIVILNTANLVATNLTVTAQVVTNVFIQSENPNGYANSVNIFCQTFANPSGELESDTSSLFFNLYANIAYLSGYASNLGAYNGGIWDVGTTVCNFNSSGTVLVLPSGTHFVGNPYFQLVGISTGVSSAGSYGQYQVGP
jgi:hypothetical protein